MGSKQSLQLNSLSAVDLPNKQDYTGANSLTSATPIIQKIDDFDELRLRTGFRQYAGPNGLSRSAFHIALGILEDLGLRRLRETPLGDRLFSCFDMDGNGAVQEDEFVTNAAILIGNDQNRKTELTFKAYSSSHGVVYVHELLHILTQSWLSAFWFLAERLGSKNEKSSWSPPAQAIQSFASRNAAKFRESVLATLSPYITADTWQLIDRDQTSSGSEQEKMYLNAANFIRWASEDRTISAEWNGITVRVACTLFNIEKAPENFLKSPIYPRLQN